MSVNELWPSLDLTGLTAIQQEKVYYLVKQGILHASSGVPGWSFEVEGLHLDSSTLRAIANFIDAEKQSLWEGYEKWLDEQTGC